LKKKNNLISMLLSMALAFSLCANAQAINHVTAFVASPAATIDGEAITLTTYNIAGSNYIKLRDLAYYFRDTAKQFGVDWDAGKGAISITSGKEYTPVGGETASAEPNSETAATSTAKAYLNGKYVYMEAFNISGYNYFKLRDAASVLDFGLTWDSEKSTIEINTKSTNKLISSAPVDFKVGVILVGDENDSYSLAHIEGVEAARDTLGLSREQVIYKYCVSEDETCYDAACDLVRKGCKIIFSNSYGHQSYLQQAATENPDVQFCQAYGDTALSSGLPNLHDYFARIHEARYVSGVVAGLKLKELMNSGKVTDPHIGFVGAFPYSEVVSSYTAFFLGIKSIVPDAHMDVKYSNSWYDPTEDASAAKALIDSGCVIISQFSDSPNVSVIVENAYKNDTPVFYAGFNNDFLCIAPDVTLTSAMNDWSLLYTEIIEAVIKCEKLNPDLTAGYSENGVYITALGDSCAAGTEEKVREIEAEFSSGTRQVFDCSAFTVNGKHISSYKLPFQYQGFIVNGREMIWNGYFHECELISAPVFDMNIDGITELNVIRY
jgi:basic membrane protein A and related proteins